MVQIDFGPTPPYIPIKEPPPEVPMIPTLPLIPVVIIAAQGVRVAVHTG